MLKIVIKSESLIYVNFVPIGNSRMQSNSSANSELMVVLDDLMNKTRFSSRALGKATDVSWRTIENWRGGKIKKPRKWWDLIKLAQAMQLKLEETNRLLQAAGHKTLAELKKTKNGKLHAELFALWEPKEKRPFFPPLQRNHLVGREAELAQIERALMQGKFVNVCQIQGMGGVGKTALALHLAYQLDSFFKDGVLWVNLSTTSSMAALRIFARALDIDLSTVSEEAELSVLVRDLLREKKMLVVLDDVQNDHQLETLIPPNGGQTAVIITTRFDLPAADRFERIEIRPFSPESRATFDLFTHYLGQKKVMANRRTLVQIATMLGYLPLALVLAAGQLSRSANQSIPQFFERLQEEEKVLDQLTRGRSIRLSFDVSYKALTPQQQQLFATLGVFDGDSFDLAAATAVSPLSSAETTQELALLTRLFLVQEGVNGRYSLHTLLKSYAREKLTTSHPYKEMARHYIELEQGEEESLQKKIHLELSNILAALQTSKEQQFDPLLLQGINRFSPYLEARGLQSIVNEYLSIAEQLINNKTIFNNQLAPTLINLAYHHLLRGDYEKSHRYLDQGFAHLDQFIPSQQLRLQQIKGDLLYLQGQMEEAYTLLETALSTARALQDKRAIVGIIITFSKVVANWQGDLQKTLQLLEEAYQIAKTEPNENRIGNLLINLGSLSYHLGDLEKAKQYFTDGAQHSRQTEDKKSLHIHLQNLGIIAQFYGQYTEATRHLEEALSLSEELEIGDSIIAVKTSLGEVYRDRNRLNEAASWLLDAIQDAAKQQSYREGYARAILGSVWLKKRAFVKAKEELSSAWEACKEGKDVWDLFSVHRWYGELYLLIDDIPKAKTHIGQGAKYAQESGIPILLGTSLFQQAELHLTCGDPEKAKELAKESLAILRPLKAASYREVEIFLRKQK